MTWPAPERRHRHTKIPRRGSAAGTRLARLARVRREPLFRHTTILCVRREGAVALGGDGQVTMGTTVVKRGASKIRRLLDGKVLAGFAGSTADAMTLFTRFERKLEEYHGQLERAAVELAADWRTEKSLRALEALLVVADRQTSLLLSGTGDVIAPDEGILAVGSGGPLATAAARALLAHTALSAEVIVREALAIASSLDIYTNDQIRVEVLA